MDLHAWCGYCGESFRLAQVLEPAFTGRCPRCGRDLVTSYGPVASAAIHDLIEAAAAMSVAAGRLTQSAPRLHVDARKLAADIDATFEQH